MSLDTFLTDVSALDPNTIVGGVWERGSCKCPVVQLSEKYKVTRYRPALGREGYVPEPWTTMRSLADHYGLTRNDIATFIDRFDHYWKLHPATALKLTVRSYDNRV